MRAVEETIHAPFDAIAERYDEVFTNSVIGRYQRREVWRAAQHVFHVGDRLLELNCGTGVDAIWLAGRGLRVDAFDQAPRMIDIARRNLEASGLRNRVRFAVLDNKDLSRLRPSYDGVFSNFSGLNCIDDLRGVARELARLLRPKAPALLCFSARRCLWELGWYSARLDFRRAFRRWSRGPTTASVGGEEVRVQYFSERALRRIFSPHFVFRWAQGIGILVPPTYAERFARKLPRVVAAASWVDSSIARLSMVREAGDHLLVCFVRGGR